MTNPPKTIIIVPGAWHGPEHFDQVAQKLQESGYKTISVALKSVGAEPPLTDFWPDVEAIRTEISKATDAGEAVMVVAHSYGGIPSSQATEGFDIESRKAAGKPGGVVHMFYVASFMIPEGKSLDSAFGGDAPWYDVNEDRTLVKPMSPEKVFYNDMPEDLAKKCVVSLRPHSYRCMHSELKWAAWKHGVPATYLYALQDQAIPIALQRKMVEDFAEGYPISTETVDASHSPFHSKVEETVNAIRRAAGEKV